MPRKIINTKHDIIDEILEVEPVSDVKPADANYTKTSVEKRELQTPIRRERLHAGYFWNKHRPKARRR